MLNYESPDGDTSHEMNDPPETGGKTHCWNLSKRHRSRNIEEKATDPKPNDEGRNGGKKNHGHDVNDGWD
jgi:hypothetical protein